jgi:deferrochelatase/peroxidase EfeB
MSILGAPLEHFPKEDPARDKNGPQWDFGNNWQYKEPIDELRCPYGSHIRKSNPRNNFGQSAHNLDKSLIMRRGIPYGSDYSEATKDEKRGLLFGCYQSNVMNGYACIMDSKISQIPLTPSALTHLQDGSTTILSR